MYKTLLITVAILQDLCTQILLLILYTIIFSLLLQDKRRKMFASRLLMRWNCTEELTFLHLMFVIVINIDV